VLSTARIYYLPVAGDDVTGEDVVVVGATDVGTPVGADVVVVGATVVVDGADVVVVGAADVVVGAIVVVVGAADVGAVVVVVGATVIGLEVELVGKPVGAAVLLVGATVVTVGTPVVPVGATVVSVGATVVAVGALEGCCVGDLVVTVGLFDMEGAPVVGVKVELVGVTVGALVMGPFVRAAFAPVAVTSLCTENALRSETGTVTLITMLNFCLQSSSSALATLATIKQDAKPGR